MSEWSGSADAKEWKCARCGVAPVVQKVRLQYLATIFPIDLPACPCCGMVLVDEELALKMAEAEKILEDK